MKNLRLVNLHWSLWATRDIKLLRIAGHCIASMELPETLAEKYINLSTLHPYKMNMISDDGLHALLKISSLTHFDFTRVAD